MIIHSVNEQSFVIKTKQQILNIKKKLTSFQKEKKKITC